MVKFGCAALLRNSGPNLGVTWQGLSVPVPGSYADLWKVSLPHSQANDSFINFNSPSN